jgi:hypothetical protein
LEKEHSDWLEAIELWRKTIIKKITKMELPEATNDLLIEVVNVSIVEMRTNRVEMK